MLTLDKKLWDSDRIIKIRSSSNWSGSDTEVLLNCTLNEIEELLDQCIKENKKCIWIIDCVKGDAPSIYYLSKITFRFLSMKEKLTKGLHFTLLYCMTTSYSTLLNTVLAIYTPARPIYIVKSKDEIKEHIDNKSKYDT